MIRLLGVILYYADSHIRTIPNHRMRHFVRCLILVPSVQRLLLDVLHALQLIYHSNIAYCIYISSVVHYDAHEEVYFMVRNSEITIEMSISGICILTNG